MNDVPKELLRTINMDDSPERLTDNAGGLGNMPELTLLLEDDEVVRKFSVSLIISIQCNMLSLQSVLSNVITI